MRETLERQSPIVIVFTEDDCTTRADVVLDMGGHHFHCWGRALRVGGDAPDDVEQVAAARALACLAEELLDVHHPG